MWQEGVFRLFISRHDVWHSSKLHFDGANTFLPNYSDLAHALWHHDKVSSIWKMSAKYNQGRKGTKCAWKWIKLLKVTLWIIQMIASVIFLVIFFEEIHSVAQTDRSSICKNGRFVDNPIGFTHSSCPLDIVHHKINILFPNLPTTDDVNSFRNIQRREWPE